MDEPSGDSEQAELEAILQTALEMGVLVQMSGGYTARIRDTMQHVAVALGAERAETWVSSGSIGLVVHRGGWSRTSVRTTPAIGVNFAELSQLSRLAKRSPDLTLAQVRAEIDEVAQRDKRYPLPLVLVMLGVSTGSFAALFGADAYGIALAALGGLVGATVRALMLKGRFKPFVHCFFAAFAAVSVVRLLSSVGPALQSGAANTAVTASILFLVPGVPLLNGTADLLTSNYLNGLVRLTRASVILMGATMGLAIAELAWRWV